LAVKARFSPEVVYNCLPAFKQSGEVLHILSFLSLTLRRLGLRIKAKMWIYNKYQEGAGFLLTFFPAEKSKCHARGKSGRINFKDRSHNTDNQAMS
jgi:hypothetical protein